MIWFRKAWSIEIGDLQLVFTWTGDRPTGGPFQTFITLWTETERPGYPGCHSPADRFENQATEFCVLIQDC